MSETYVPTEPNPFGPPCPFPEYEKKAMEYRLPTADTIYAQINLAGEVGELLSLFAKARRDNPMGFSDKQRAEFKASAKKEIGDILWCLTAIAQDLEVSLEECALMNLVKLRQRKLRGTLQGSGDDR